MLRLAPAKTVWERAAAKFGGNSDEVRTCLKTTPSEHADMARKRRSVLRALGAAAVVGSVAGCTEDDTTADAGAAQADETVMVTDFEFQPAFLSVEAGTTVAFVGEEGANDHTVSAYHEDNGRQHRVPDGATAFDFDVEDGGQGTVTFDTEGVYDYYCGHHESGGMVGSILVGEAEEGANGLADPDESDLPADAADAIRRLNDEARAELGYETEGDRETDTDDGGGGGSDYY